MLGGMQFYYDADRTSQGRFLEPSLWRQQNWSSPNMRGESFFEKMSRLQTTIFAFVKVRIIKNFLDGYWELSVLYFGPQKNQNSIADRRWNQVHQPNQNWTDRIEIEIKTIEST